MERTLLIVDDHHGVAEGLGRLLGTDGPPTVHHATTSAEAMALAARHRPHLVSVDLELGPEDGVTLLSALAEEYPHLPLVVLTDSSEPARALASIAAGARAFIPKATPPDQIIEAFDVALDGDTWLPRSMLGPTIDLALHPPPPDEWHHLVSTLSTREREVLELMVAGLNRREIADRLVISLNTVRTHVKKILSRLGVHSSLEAVSLALRAGLRPPGRS